MSKDKKQEEIGKIVKGLSEEELNDLRTKTENLKRLERGDYR
jgi:ATP-dependent DNA ligase